MWNVNVIICRSLNRIKSRQHSYFNLFNLTLASDGSYPVMIRVQKHEQIKSNVTFWGEMDLILMGNMCLNASFKQVLIATICPFLCCIWIHRDVIWSSQLDKHIYSVSVAMEH